LGASEDWPYTLDTFNKKLLGETGIGQYVIKGILGRD
jgi:hypothetical protein